MAAQLKPLPDIERLSSRVIRILGGNPGKICGGTNTYIVGTGRKRLLIDTGEGKPAWISSIQTVLKRENVTITDAILTHWHHDHTLGQADLLRISPETKIYKNTPVEGQCDIKDGQTFKVDGASLKAFSSPGHTYDHMVLVLEEEDAMFTADNVLGHGTAVFEDLAAYLTSLEKMRRLFRGRAYPGHGPVIDDGPSRILEYIQHRKLREDQVIQVLKSTKSSPGVEVTNGQPDDWTSMEIVKIIYKNVPEELHIPAEGGIMQILTKLESEGKIEENSNAERWRLKGRAAL